MNFHLPFSKQRDRRAQRPAVKPPPTVTVVEDIGRPLDTLRFAYSSLMDKHTSMAVLLDDKTGGPGLLLLAPISATDEMAIRTLLVYLSADARYTGVEALRVTPSVLAFVSEKLKHANQLATPEADKEAFNAFREIVQRAFDSGASDLRFSVVGHNVKVLVRIDGEIRRFPDSLTRDRAEQLLRAAFAKSEDNANSGSQLEFNQYMNTAVSVNVQEGPHPRRIQLRMQSSPQRGGHLNACRLLAQQERSRDLHKPLAETLVEIGFMPDQAYEIALRSLQGSGAGLSVGETGSGKTNTMYSICSALAVPGKAGHSVEDPVEGTIFGMNQHTIQVREGQTRRQAYEEAFTALLRSDPDFILIGEIRDDAAGQAFLDSSDAGHYTLSTLHAESAVGAYRRLTSRLIGLPIEVITAPGFIAWVAHHKLLQRLCTHCKLPLLRCKRQFADPAFGFGRTELRLLGLLGEPESVFMRNPEGCAHCRQRTPGVQGRTLAAGLFLPDDETLELIQAQRYASVQQVLRSRWLFDRKCLKAALAADKALYKSGMEVGIWKMLQGEIDPREVISAFRHFGPYLQALGVEYG
ncbi:ATPase, T2SS/T4P/T4SS family [Chitinimonas sp. BJB300]|uniref:ATPase, T2SS/T4P/T4SS family n=1 Tax=Chitinimonas sp. BJB300 TaxID=1559339 RepID=UPI000C0CA936|nr:ATPase, T2SS/T4P/T4SS family [Chitinimonas sp. BJB300]PHV12040.1 hypothetical protein CSQ89_07820 [Chitinimonas sp. BJB300]TSJ84923.1 hypothetical protein FG002_018365 [Chitinimonas sp. BJB300]